MLKKLYCEPIFILILLVFTIVLFVITGVKTAPSFLIILYNVLIFIFLFGKIFFDRKKFFLLKESYIHLEILFFIFYFIIYYLPYLPFLFEGKIQESTFISRQFLEQSNRAITASSIGLISFVLGLNIFPYRKKICRKKIFEDYELSKIVHYISIILALIFGFSFMPQALLMIGSSYVGSEFSDLNQTINYFFLQFFLSLLIVMTSYRYIIYKKNFFLLGLSVVIYISFVSLILLTGDRSGVIKLLAIPVFIISHYIYRIRLVYILLGAIVVFIGYDFIEIFRALDKFTIEDYNEMLSYREDKHGNDSSFNNTTTITRSAFYYIDCLHNVHTNGRFLLISILRVIPFGISIFMPNEQYYGTGEILTNLCHSDFSLGSSIIAEAYIEFGILGIIVYMFVLGIIIRYFARRLSYSPYDLFNFTLYVIIFSVVIILPRYSTALLIREFFWSLFLIMSLKYICRK